MQWRNADGNTISDDLVQVDRDAVWWFLKDSYWLPGIAPETVDAGIDHSLVFSLLALAGAQAEFARAVTDRRAPGSWRRWCGPWPRMATTRPR